jgi:plasmid stabilization system protein ParE
VSGDDGDESDPEEPVTIYALRIGPRAERDIAAAVARFLEQEGSGEAIAAAWERGLYAAFGTLATQPRRYLVAREAMLFPGRELRQLVYRRTPSSVAYRLLYSVEDAGMAEGPTVRLVHMRHGSARAMTWAEAQEIKAQDQS